MKRFSGCILTWLGQFGMIRNALPQGLLFLLWWSGFWRTPLRCWTSIGGKNTITWAYMSVGRRENRWHHWLGYQVLWFQFMNKMCSKRKRNEKVMGWGMVVFQLFCDELTLWYLSWKMSVLICRLYDFLIFLSTKHRNIKKKEAPVSNLFYICEPARNRCLCHTV